MDELFLSAACIVFPCLMFFYVVYLHQRKR